MRKPHLFITLLTLVIARVLQLQAHAAPAGSLIKHLSSLLKWSTSGSKISYSDDNFLQFEDGYLVETVVEGNELGVIPYSIQITRDGELFAVDATSSNIVRITPPLSQYSRARLVAGSFQGYAGHVDGKPSDARFKNPKGVTVDDKGNVYVADISNLAIRKIGEAGVTTIAGGKSNVAGYRDGPCEHAMFSNDFDVLYVRRTCSLLVVDRGNAALRQISLNEQDCDYHYSSISTADVILVIGAVLVGYGFCMLHQGFGPSYFSKNHQPLETKFKDQPRNVKPVPIAESIKSEPSAPWPSFGHLLMDLSKLALELLASVALYFLPVKSQKGLVPLKDHLKMPEDEVVHLQQVSPTIPETKEKYPEKRPPKTKSSMFKDLSKHRLSKRNETVEYYGRSEVNLPYGQPQPKSQKERSRHRQREKNGEVGFVAVGSEVTSKHVESKPLDYEASKYDRYGRRSKYRPDNDAYRF